MTDQEPPEDTLSMDEWVGRITATYHRSVDGVVEVGRDLVAARAGMDRTNFTRLLELLPFDRRSAQRYMSVARHPRIGSGDYNDRLPSAVGTLYELSRLTCAQFDWALGDDYLIGPDMTRDQAGQIKDAYLEEHAPCEAGEPEDEAEDEAEAEDEDETEDEPDDRAGAAQNVAAQETTRVSPERVNRDPTRTGRRAIDFGDPEPTEAILKMQKVKGLFRKITDAGLSAEDMAEHGKFGPADWDQVQRTASLLTDLVALVPKDEQTEDDDAD